MRITAAERARLMQPTEPVTRVAYMAHGVMLDEGWCEHHGPIDSTAHLGRIASDLARAAAMRGWPTHALTGDEAAVLLDLYLTGRLGSAAPSRSNS